MDNLPSEDVLISDLNEFLRLYKFLSDSVSVNNELGIKKFLDTILKRYKGVRAKGEKVSGNPLSAVFNTFAGNLKDYVNSNEISGTSNNYITKSVHFGGEKFVSGPYLYIYNNEISGFYIGYMFREDMRGVYLALNLGGGGTFGDEYEENKQNFPSRKDFKKFYLNNIRNKLNKKTEITERFGKSTEGAWFHNNTIYAKYYEKNNLPSEEQLINDLNDILRLYNLIDEPQIKIIPKSITIIKKLFENFNENYLKKDLGIEHRGFHDKERGEVKKYFNQIKNDEKVVYDNSNPIINYLLPIKRFSVAPAGVKDFSAYKNPPEKIPEITLAAFHLVDDLIKENDETSQKDLIRSFKAKNYKGFQSGIISSVFYYLNSKYWYINTKTVNTYNFLNEILGNESRINGNLDEYIDNLNKLKGLLNELSLNIPELSDFETFDIFCHWMCEKSLGYYAIDRKKYEEWLNINFPDIIETPINPYESFSTFLKEKGYLFDSETIENFLLSLKIKPFVILTGNSGTGKTKLAQLFSEYLAIENGECHKIVPVGANWTENRHIVGFYNVITKEYMKSDALELILEAQKIENIEKAFILILDEMNLSHVERYFADFLSAMESEEEISLYKIEDEEEEEEGIPKSLKIPKNLFVIGTVNVDETTYMFSPKVLDRANVIEFSTSSAKDYMLNEFNEEELTGNIGFLENPIEDIGIRKYRIDKLRTQWGSVKTNEGILWDLLSEELNDFQKILKKGGFDFGFRVIDEILRFMHAAWIYENEPEIWDNWERYFDSQIKQKMLPKLHGSQRILETVLKELFEQCYTDSLEISPRYVEDLELDPKVKYLSSAKKIQQMDKVLNEQRYVSFIN